MQHFLDFKVRVKNDYKSSNGKLGFINIKKEDGDWKFQKSYENWIKNSQYEDLYFSNDPMSGFTINTKIKHYCRYSDTDPKVRVLDPRGFEIEIKLENFFELLPYGVEKGRVIAVPLVYLMDGNSIALHPANSDLVKSLIETSSFEENLKRRYEGNAKFKDTEPSKTKHGVLFVTSRFPENEFYSSIRPIVLTHKLLSVENFFHDYSKDLTIAQHMIRNSLNYQRNLDVERNDISVSDDNRLIDYLGMFREFKNIVINNNNLFEGEKITPTEKDLYILRTRNGNEYLIECGSFVKDYLHMSPEPINLRKLCLRYRTATHKIKRLSTGHCLIMEFISSNEAQELFEAKYSKLYKCVIVDATSDDGFETKLLNELKEIYFK